MQNEPNEGKLRKVLNPLAGEFTFNNIDIYAGQKNVANADTYYQIGDRTTNNLIAELTFQNGLVTETGVNGVTNEALLAVVIDRLRGFQSGSYSCRENAQAIAKLEEALLWLKARELDREKRQVLSTYEK